MNKHYQIVRENPARSLVNHRDIGLAPQTVSELPPHHAEGGFDVRPLMVVGHEVSAAELKVMEHLRL